MLTTFYLNAAGSLLAVGANLYGVRCGDPLLRGLRAAIGALAGFYFAGYVWVIDRQDVLAWSAFYRKVALVAWILVWCLPPLLGTKAHQKTKRSIEETARTLQHTLETEIPR